MMCDFSMSERKGHPKAWETHTVPICFQPRGEEASFSPKHMKCTCNKQKKKQKFSEEDVFYSDIGEEQHPVVHSISKAI